MSPADRPSQTARRKAIYDELHPEMPHGGEPSRKDCDLPAERFTASTAAVIGRSERAVQLDAERGGLAVHAKVACFDGFTLQVLEQKRADLDHPEIAVLDFPDLVEGLASSTRPQQRNSDLLDAWTSGLLRA